MNRNNTYKPRETIFVFGSNKAGRHGAGAALYAKEKYGAEYGVGVGLTGKSYAIPTKDETINTMTVEEIKHYVDMFIKFARKRKDLKFQVTKIGCGLAGHKNEDMAKLFMDAPLNCEFDTEWKSLLGDKFKYWGTG